MIGSVALPLGWVWVRIDEVSNVGTGATPLKGNPKYYESGAVSWVTSGLLNELFITKVEEKITELAVKETNAKVFPKHTLLVAMYGEGKTRGKVSELLVEAATNQACAALVFGGEASKLRPFVKLFLQKNYNDIRRLSSGGVQPNLNLGIIKATKVPIPPLNEQRRIVAKVEALKARSQRVKQELEAIPALLDQFRQSVLAAAFRGDLTADWREKKPDVEPLSELLAQIQDEIPKQKNKKKVTEIADPFKLPDNWTWISLSKICRVITDGDHQIIPKVSQGLPLVDISHIRCGKLDFSNTRYISEEYYQAIQEYKKPIKGDLLYSAVGSYGIPALVDTDIKFYFQRNIALLRASDLINRKYLLYALKSSFAFRQATEVATGTSQLLVTLSALGKIKVPITSVAEQQEIVSRVEALLKVADQVEQQYQQAKAHLDQFNQSILAKAFRGELVPQDPNDEPASVLLERIRAEREKLDTKKKAKGKTEKKSRKAQPEPAEPKQLSLPGFE
ncbi:restriction endonuclease subunit S [Microcoleus vaginatus GB1-A2]|uniref:restriction endonuclease subunit S n=1 Tax=Microcoleus vaginatus TaxID=119532 RepID=UPI001682D453|nr:restriction endonuclease subunit S [Microcoleus sp. FACHB-61]